MTTKVIVLGSPLFASLRFEIEIQPGGNEANKDLLDAIYWLSACNELRPEAKKFDLCRKMYFKYLSKSSDLTLREGHKTDLIQESRAKFSW